MIYYFYKRVFALWCMENFIKGLQAIFGEAGNTLSAVTDYPLFWGFAVGFFTSTIVHAFLMTDHPQQVSTVLFQEKAKGFETLYPAKPNGTFTKSYSDYSKMADRVKTLFLIATFILTLLIFIAILRK